MSEFDLQTSFLGESLGSWVDQLHACLAAQCQMQPFHIEQDDYAYGAYAAVISTILTRATPSDILGSMRGLLPVDEWVGPVHQAWVANYIAWKSKCPEQAHADSRQSLNTYERNDRATTTASQLQPDDLELYRSVVTTVFELLGKKTLEAGMQRLRL